MSRYAYYGGATGCFGTRENMCDSRLRRESRRFSGWVTSRGEHARTRQWRRRRRRRRVPLRVGSGCRGAVGYEWGEEREEAEERRGKERGDGRPRAINIPKYAGTRAHINTYTRARARTPVRVPRTSSRELCQYMPSRMQIVNIIWAACVLATACVRTCVRVGRANCKCNVLAHVYVAYCVSNVDEYTFFEFCATAGSGFRVELFFVNLFPTSYEYFNSSHWQEKQSDIVVFHKEIWGTD